MVTDVEMEFMGWLIEKCDDEYGKQILQVAQEALGDLDVNAFSLMSGDEKEEFISSYSDEINSIVNSKGPDKRYVGEYELINSFEFGDKEVFVGENLNAAKDERYVVGDCKKDGLFESYDNCVVAGDYLEIAEVYSSRISEQVQKTKDQIAKIYFDREVIEAESCTSISDVDLNGKIIVIDPKFIKREYVSSDQQLCIAKGGFGCSPDGRGRTVFCTNLSSGEEVTWYRQDVLGVIKPDCLPRWAQSRIKEMQIKGEKSVENLILDGQSRAEGRAINEKNSEIQKADIEIEKE